MPSSANLSRESEFESPAVILRATECNSKNHGEKNEVEILSKWALTKKIGLVLYENA